jgi:hypothetical protein
LFGGRPLEIGVERLVQRVAGPHLPLGKVHANDVARVLEDVDDDRDDGDGLGRLDTGPEHLGTTAGRSSAPAATTRPPMAVATRGVERVGADEVTQFGEVTCRVRHGLALGKHPLGGPASPTIAVRWGRPL